MGFRGRVQTRRLECRSSRNRGFLWYAALICQSRMGLRGVGKTVLLDVIRENAESSGVLALRIEAPEISPFLRFSHLNCVSRCCGSRTRSRRSTMLGGPCEGSPDSPER